LDDLIEEDMLKVPRAKESVKGTTFLNNNTRLYSNDNQMEDDMVSSSMDHYYGNVGYRQQEKGNNQWHNYTERQRNGDINNNRMNNRGSNYMNLVKSAQQVINKIKCYQTPFPKEWGFYFI